MERKVVKFLEHWKEDENRKPLVVYGSKQVGKTYTVLKFGEENYSSVIYLDANDNRMLSKGLKKENTIEGIMSKIGEITHKEVLKNDTLVVIDNVNDVEIVNTIKTM